MNWQDVITFEAGKRSGKPCIRNLQITVCDILEYLASGMTPEEIVADFPELQTNDIQAALASAAVANAASPATPLDPADRQEPVMAPRRCALR